MRRISRADTLADSSVWIDLLNGCQTSATDRLATLIRSQKVVIGDLILVEVLQGFRSNADFRKVKNALSQFPVVEVCGAHIARRSAENYRKLRSLGITVRGTVDCIIATYCIETNVSLLYADRDFDPFVSHLKLQSTMQA